MEKINILWIEDNPIQEAVKVKAVIKREKQIDLLQFFQIADHNEAIPAIHFDRELQHHHQYFNLQVLQHPVEIKDFITMCLQLEDMRGQAAFKEMKVVLPDIIVFDYHFSAKIAINRGLGAIAYYDRFKRIREFVNPNFKFKEKFPQLFGKKRFILEEQRINDYNVDDFLQEISKATDKAEIKTKDRDELESDDFGLFSAIEILRIFRGHTTVAVPSTFNKRRTEQLSLHGKYFEWLNEYDLSIDFERPERGTKKWDEILKDGAKALQIKIIQQVRQGRLTPHLVQLSLLATGLAENSSANRKMMFRNAYGVHQYPLDGLFLDVPEGMERDQAIRAWAADLFHAGIERDDKRAENVIIHEAIQHADTLWAAYQSQLFCDRLLLSKLHKLHTSKTEQKLSSDLEEKYENFLNGSGGFVMIKEKSRTNEIIYTIQNAVEIKGLLPKKGNSYTERQLAILSWTALFVILKMFKGRADYLKAHQLHSTVLPSRKELLTVLFPIASTPLKLPLDGGDEKTMNDFMKRLFFNLDELVVGDANLFSEDRKFILRAYAESIGLSDERFLPDWIKQI